MEKESITMAYKDPEKRRAYDRQYKRAQRAGEISQTYRPTLPIELRIQTAQDVLDMLNQQVNAVLADSDISTVEKARCITYMASSMLKAIEQVAIVPRLEAIEDIINSRKNVS